MKIPLLKEVKTLASNGVMEFDLIEDTWYLTYHNPLYTGSPFKLEVCFSGNYDPQKILKTPEIERFLSRFN